MHFNANQYTLINGDDNDDFGTHTRIEMDCVVGLVGWLVQPEV